MGSPGEEIIIAWAWATFAQDFRDVHRRKEGYRDLRVTDAAGLAKMGSAKGGHTSRLSKVSKQQQT